MKRTVLITGSSRGIGAAIAEKFGLSGDRVIINCKSSINEGEELAKKLRNQGVDAEFFGADLSNFNETQKMVNKIGKIDVLINNAGISQIKLFTETSTEDWHNIMAANLDSVYNATYCVLPDMINEKKGVIINISSMWGIVGSSCEVAYSTSKAAVIGFTKALAKEVGPSGIRVNCVAPGMIDTKMNNTLTQEDKNALINETPLNRMGTTEDVANAVLFLASNDASFITGQVITVDGGLTV